MSTARPWQVYEKPTPGLRYHHPDALEQPKMVDLLYDRDATIIGIRPATQEQTAMRVNLPKNPAGSYVISGRGFFHYFGIDHPGSKRHPTRVVDEGVLLVDLYDYAQTTEA